jgi:hypothetical protein
MKTTFLRFFLASSFIYLLAAAAHNLRLLSVRMVMIEVGRLKFFSLMKKHTNVVNERKKANKKAEWHVMRYS